MEDLVDVARNYNPWKWWKFRRYSVEVSRHLRRVEDHQRTLAMQLDQWIHTRSPITAETVQTVRAQYQSDAELCTRGNPWTIDAQMAAFMQREHTWVSDTKAHQHLSQRFALLAAQFLQTFTAIESTQHDVNRLLEAHATRCAAFSEEEAALRQGYIARAAIEKRTAGDKTVLNVRVRNAWFMCGTSLGVYTNLSGCSHGRV